MYTIEYLKAWLFSVLAYRTDDCVDIIHKEFSHHTAHFLPNEDGSHFYGMVTDDLTNIAYVIDRGTGGFDPVSELHSWFYNMMSFYVGDDGVGDGFELLGNETFDRFKDRLPNYHKIITGGHSQGGGTCQRVAQLCCRHLSKKHQIVCYPFAAPPCFKGPAITEMDLYQKSKTVDGYDRLSGFNTIMPGDPLGAEILREKTGGEDIFAVLTLPDIIKQKLYVGEVINHSPSMYTAAMLITLAMDQCPKLEQYFLLGKAAQYAIN